MSDITIAQQTIQTEIDGLITLKSAIDENFTKVIETIAAMKSAGKNGRVIVTGMGKSGHIGSKIAATLASTGTPAYFVHPGEASHGDLGMVTQHDIVLMISNSGEAQELSDFIHYTRRYGITLISISSNAGSTLVQHSDIPLIMPKSPEACPNGLAPTTSTTMTLALGDALAIALLNRMKLSPDDFRAFHPGGKLGQQLQPVTALMIPYADMAIISPGAKMDTVILALTQKNLGAAIIANSPTDIKGIITDGDLKRHMSPDLMSKPVTAIMSTAPKSIAANALAVQALNVMTKTPNQYITSLLVMDKDTLLGMIRLQDCLQAGLT
jgi:arabinose-5-phosphate isomerase